MRNTGFGWSTACAALLGFGLVGCGGEEQAPPPEAPEASSGEAVAEQLTAEEAALLAEFRASRAGEGSAGPKSQAGEPEVAAHAEPAAGNPFDFDPSPSAKPPADAGKPSNPAAATATSDKPTATQAPAKPAPEPAPTPNPASANTPTVFVQHKITDSKYNNMVATTVLYPENWKVDGGITRLPDAYYSVAFLADIKFTAPDGRAVHFFPTLSFEFGGQGQGQSPQLFSPTGDGNMYYPLPESPGQWIMDLAKQQPDPTVSNLKLVSEEPEPALTKQLQQQSAQLYQMIQDGKYMAQQTGVGTAYDTQATVIVLRYTQDGIELEETILVAWNYFLNLWNGQVTGGAWGVPLMVSMRGPVGSDYMMDPELMAIFHSVRPNPQWLQKQQAYWQELARIRKKGADDRNRDWQIHNAKMQQINNETNAIIAGGHANRTAIRDAGHAKQMDSVREVTPYELPGGETVKIPDYYDNVHTDGAGRFILSNDMNYNPNRDLNLSGSWTEVAPKQ